MAKVAQWQQLVETSHQVARRNLSCPHLQVSHVLSPPTVFLLLVMLLKSALCYGLQ